MRPFLPVYQPDLSGNERRYLLDAFDSTWISSRGAYLDRFERAFAEYTGLRYVSAVCNGTVALHLALHSLDLRPGDEVIVPSFTYIASVNTIVQAGGTPVFADVAPDDWLLDPEAVAAAITPRTRAILPVHLYGAACDMERLSALARAHGLAVVEDCAEALGTWCAGRHVGAWSDVATFSFFGNKTVTTGEGGMVATNDAGLYQKLVLAKGQGMDPARRYWHIVMGFNYRMTNLCAAIGLAQLERLPDILARKRHIAARYRANCANSGLVFQVPRPQVESSEWLVSVLLPEGSDRDRIMGRLAERGIETRPVFYCAHHMPHHYRPDVRLPVSEAIAARGISLPSWPGLTDADIDRVSEELLNAIRAA